MAKAKLTPIPRATKAKAPAPEQAAPIIDLGPDLSHIAPELRPLAKPLADLAFLAGNAVDHPGDQIEDLKALLTERGQLEPLIVNRARSGLCTVIGGNGRLSAMLALGYTHAAWHAIEVDDATADQISIELNRSAEGRVWNKTRLDALMDRVKAAGVKMAPRVAEMMERLRKERGTKPVAEVGAPALPDGDKATFQQLTFTLHDTQAETVKRAIDKAKECGGGKSDVNENSNGNALAILAGAYLVER